MALELSDGALVGTAGDISTAIEQSFALYA
jgi:hypothetical protein